MRQGNGTPPKARKKTCQGEAIWLILPLLSDEGKSFLILTPSRRHEIKRNQRFNNFEQIS